MAEKKTSPETAANPQAAEAGEQAPQKKVIKKELVRLALATLGSSATPTEIQRHIKEQYGVDMNLGHISTTKGELRRAAAKQAEEAAQPEAAAPATEPAAAESTEATPKAEKITGVDAVRQVMPGLGKDPEPEAIQQAVKERYNLDLKLDYVAKLKGKILKEMKKQKHGKKAAKPAEKEEPKPAQEQPATQQAAPPAGNGKEELWSDILTLHELVKRVGAEKIRTFLSMMTQQPGS